LDATVTGVQTCALPISRPGRRSVASLQVLELLPELLELAFHRDYGLRDRGVVRLRSDRVYLPQQLLRQEAELLAHRPVLGERFAASGEMGAQPDQLLGDIDPVHHERDLDRA